MTSDECCETCGGNQTVCSICETDCDEHGDGEREEVECPDCHGSGEQEADDDDDESL